ncbi:MAG: TlpA family protein disulfide reductase [Promethearchaeota archaeon]
MSEFEEMLSRAIPISEYLASLASEDQAKYKARRQNYTPKKEILENLRQIVNNFIVLMIGASWCKDCVTHTPVLEMIHKATGLRVEVLGGVKSDPLNSNRRWAVPPSPPEVDTLKITRIPTILVYSLDGKEVGRIIENPQIKPTLEEELLYIMTKSAN